MEILSAKFCSSPEVEYISISNRRPPSGGETHLAVDCTKEQGTPLCVKCFIKHVLISDA